MAGTCAACVPLSVTHTATSSPSQDTWERSGGRAHASVRDPCVRAYTSGWCTNQSAIPHTCVNSNFFKARIIRYACVNSKLVAATIIQYD